MDNISKRVTKFKIHPSIIKIKEKGQINVRFSFSLSTLNEIEGNIKDLNCKKSTTKILMDNMDISSKYIIQLL